MEPRLLALKLLLDELAVPITISSVDDRKAIQKAVYLAQRAGVDLGYRFGWYVRGPYSPRLAEDYYALAGELDGNPNGQQDRTLVPAARKRLTPVKTILTPPADVELSKPDWLELLASWHFLRAVSGKNREDAMKIMQGKKQGLVPHVDRADARLQEVGLLSPAA